MRVLIAILCFLIVRLAAFAAGGGNAEIKMIHAEGKIFYHETHIAWSTEFEQHAAEFMIEATSNGTDWNLRGKVKSQGNPNKVTEYQYIDTKAEGVQQYRIRITDSKGKSLVLSQFSPENYSVEVKLEEVVIDKERKLLLDYTINQDQELLVRIYNRIGEQVYTKLLPSKLAGEYFYQLDINHLKPDNYLLVVTQVLLDKAVAEKAFQVKK